jgi:hypothetical protein
MGGELAGSTLDSYDLSRYAARKIAPFRAPQELPVEIPSDFGEAHAKTLEPREAVPAKRPFRTQPKAAPVPPKAAPVRDGTVRAAVLEVLHEQQEPITTEALALECWRRWPERFGMKVAPEHPCTNAVYAKLAALTTDGYVTRPSVGMVRITREGASAYTRGTL